MTATEAILGITSLKSHERVSIDDDHSLNSCYLQRNIKSDLNLKKLVLY